jgi:hypothetical protein
VADEADLPGGAALAAGLAAGAGELEPARWAGGDPAAGQQVQRRRLTIRLGTGLLEGVLAWSASQRWWVIAAAAVHGSGQATAW